MHYIGRHIAIRLFPHDVDTVTVFPGIARSLAARAQSKKVGTGVPCLSNISRRVYYFWFE